MDVSYFRQSKTNYEQNPTKDPHCRGSWEPPHSDKRVRVAEAPSNLTGNDD
jgi:hypothetical protein